MRRIFSSATKLVLLLFAVTVCAGFLMGKIETAIFMGAAGTVFAFYFGTSKPQGDDINIG